MQRRASMPLADSASGSGESHAKGSVPPPITHGDSKAATVLAIEICAKCWTCCRGAASEREWPSPVESSPVRMLPVAAASPPEDLLFSMSSTLSARSSAVEPGSRASGAKVASGTNGPESALSDDQSSDLGLSSGDLSHALETVPPQSRSNPAGIFRGTHARGHDPQEPVCALAGVLPPARVLLSVLTPLHLQPDQPPSSTFCGYPKITQRYNLPSTGLASSVYDSLRPGGGAPNSHTWPC